MDLNRLDQLADKLDATCYNTDGNAQAMNPGERYELAIWLREYVESQGGA